MQAGEMRDGDVSRLVELLHASHYLDGGPHMTVRCAVDALDLVTEWPLRSLRGALPRLIRRRPDGQPGAIPVERGAFVSSVTDRRLAADEDDLERASLAERAYLPEQAAHV